MLPQWWAHRVAIHLLSDLWSSTFHEKVPLQPSRAAPRRLARLRELFIALLQRRPKPRSTCGRRRLRPRPAPSINPTIWWFRCRRAPARPASPNCASYAAWPAARRVVFITPLRALSAQTETTLQRTFGPLGKTISALYGSIGVSGFDEDAIRERDIVVATPEKLDFALRNNPRFSTTSACSFSTKAT